MAPVNPYAAWFTAAHREWADLLATDPSEQLELERRWQQHQAEHHRPPADPTGKADVVNLKEIGPGNSAAYLAARHTKRKLRHGVAQLKTPPLPPAVALGG